MNKDQTIGGGGGVSPSIEKTKSRSALGWFLLSIVASAVFGYGLASRQSNEANQQTITKAQAMLAGAEERLIEVKEHLLQAKALLELCLKPTKEGAK